MPGLIISTTTNTTRRRHTSGYTLLNERMNTIHNGRGAEHVANAINKYFQMMVRLIFANGGDVIKVSPLIFLFLARPCLDSLAWRSSDTLPYHP